ncbi:hypothetical protein VNI00_001016 [Paramarasmius palmivorus]|uniref:Uncharacterized protein n=1 Tax=Paramarasmius palmivorus TaxID=297713 RepID=A0AAW0E7T4_9AGAR
MGNVATSTNGLGNVNARGASDMPAVSGASGNAGASDLPSGGVNLGGPPLDVATQAGGGGGGGGVAVAGLSAVAAGPGTSVAGAKHHDGPRCVHCGRANPLDLPEARMRWYSIYCGRMVGWCLGLERATQLVLGVSGQSYEFFWNQADARKAYEDKRNARQTMVNGNPAENIILTLGPGEGRLFTRVDETA